MKNKNKNTKIEMTPEFCHSFWRSECVNSGKECYRCTFYYAEPLKAYTRKCKQLNKKNK